MENRVATDVSSDDLAALYRVGISRLEALIRDGLKRGLDPLRAGTLEAVRGDATQAYRERQLRAAQAILADIRMRSGPAALRAAYRAYAASMFAVDRVTLGRAAPASVAALETRFGGVHTRAVELLAGNLARSLERATARAGTNIETVFARANDLEGALSPRGDLARLGVGFIGRRRDDPWRKAALEELGSGTVALDTRRQVTNRLVDRLVREGTTDALTGFVDSAGRRWSLDRYATMVARTTTREATTRGAVNRIREHGLDLVTISSHGDPCDICEPYDGNTYSLDGNSPGYELLDDEPPFHPNCLHVITPAGAELDQYESTLEDATATGATRAAPPAAPEPPTPHRPPAAPAGPSPPLSDHARPSRSSATLGRARAQREASSFGDPGLEAGAAEARHAWHEAEAGRASKAERAIARKASRSIDEALGPDMVAALDDFAKAGVKWARDPNLKRAIIDGETSLEEVTHMAETELAGLEGRRAERQYLEHERGFVNKPFPCFVCGRFKTRPADVCPHCGDDPLTYSASGRSAKDVHEFNRNYGYSH